VIGPTQRPLLNNTHHSQETDIYVPGRIRTRNHSKLAAADLQLRPRGRWDGPYNNLLPNYIFYKTVIKLTLQDKN